MCAHMATLDSLLTPKQVSERLAISQATLARLYKSGQLAFVRVGRQVRFREAAVKVFISRQEGRAA
jgi:excisionase family DNA binding protein